jgi:hypothetical protein
MVPHVTSGSIIDRVDCVESEGSEADALFRHVESVFVGREYGVWDMNTNHYLRSHGLAPRRTWRDWSEELAWICVALLAGVTLVAAFAIPLLGMLR